MKLIAVLALLSLAASACDSQQAPSEANGDEPWAALRALGDSLHEAAAVGEGARAAGSDRANADGGRYLAEIAVNQLEGGVFGDPDFPAFRPQYPESAHTGFVNPDNLYESTPIRPGVEYLVRGTRGSTADLVLQVYAGRPGVKGSLRGISTLSLDAIEFDADGNFEVRVGPNPPAKNGLLTDDEAGLLLVRWSHSDWAKERAGRIEIVRVGGEGEPAPDPDVAEVARRIRAAGAAVPDAAGFWLDFVAKLRLATFDNQVMAPRSTGGQGLEGQVSAMGKWNLADDEALIVTVPKADTRYQGLQLGNFWFDALEWSNRQTSLSGGQAQLASDGAYHYVISRQDPGVPNWLDTTGLPEGLFFLRFQGLRTPIPEADNPTAQHVKLADLRAHLPADTSVFSREDRRRQLALRQLQVQRRFGR